MLVDSTGFCLRKSRLAYSDDFNAENVDLSLDNNVYWDVL
jgi:hypothetical protein